MNERTNTTKNTILHYFYYLLLLPIACFIFTTINYDDNNNNEWEYATNLKIVYGNRIDIQWEYLPQCIHHFNYHQSDSILCLRLYHIIVMNILVCTIKYIKICFVVTINPKIRIKLFDASNNENYISPKFEFPEPDNNIYVIIYTAYICIITTCFGSFYENHVPVVVCNAYNFCSRSSTEFLFIIFFFFESNWSNQVTKKKTNLDRHSIFRRKKKWGK